MLRFDNLGGGPTTTTTSSSSPSRTSYFRNFIFFLFFFFYFFFFFSFFFFFLFYFFFSFFFCFFSFFFETYPSKNPSRSMGKDIISFGFSCSSVLFCIFFYLSGLLCIIFSLAEMGRWWEEGGKCNSKKAQKDDKSPVIMIVKLFKALNYLENKICIYFKNNLMNYFIFIFLFYYSL